MGGLGSHSLICQVKYNIWFFFKVNSRKFRSNTNTHFCFDSWMTKKMKWWRDTWMLCYWVPKNLTHKALTRQQKPWLPMVNCPPWAAIQGHRWKIFHCCVMELCPIFVLVSHVGQWRGTEDEFNGRNKLMASHLLLSFHQFLVSYPLNMHDNVTRISAQYLTLYGSVRLMRNECGLVGKLDNLRNLGRLFMSGFRNHLKLLARGAHILRDIPNLTLIW